MNEDLHSYQSYRGTNSYIGCFKQIHISKEGFHIGFLVIIPSRCSWPESSWEFYPGILSDQFDKSSVVIQNILYN